MKLIVDKDKCISCGQCVYICEEVFGFDDDGQATAIQSPVLDENIEKANEAMESCPTGAIEEE